MNALFRTAILNQTVSSGYQALPESPSQTAQRFEQQYQNKKRTADIENTSGGLTSLKVKLN
jgi:hypothetical protein